jgi:hypothetical protein
VGTGVGRPGEAGMGVPDEARKRRRRRRRWAV